MMMKNALMSALLSTAIIGGMTASTAQEVHDKNSLMRTERLSLWGKMVTDHGETVPYTKKNSGTYLEATLTQGEKGISIAVDMVHSRISPPPYVVGRNWSNPSKHRFKVAEIYALPTGKEISVISYRCASENHLTERARLLAKELLEEYIRR